MKHVIWDVGASGPGIEAVRAFLREYHALPLAQFQKHGILAPTGDFDYTVRTWVQRFQHQYNYFISKGHKLIETGQVDFETRLVMGVPESLAVDDAKSPPAACKAQLSNLMAWELAAAKEGEKFVGQAYRVPNLPTLLAALGLDLKDKDETVSKMRVAPIPGEGYLVVPEGHSLYSKAKDKSECAALVQALGVPETKYWRRGPRVQDIQHKLQEGTVVATLGCGVYLSDYSGKSHVGIFLRKDDKGFSMLDQWRGGGGNVGIRRRKYGAEHTRSAVDPTKYLYDSNYGYRMETPDENGFYGKDYRIDTVRYRINSIRDASEYYVLLTNGHVARKDSDQGPRSTDRERAKAMVDFLFEGVDLTGPADAGKALREALEKVKPSPPPDTSLSPR